MPDHVYVYPAYLVRPTPRSAGRRVPSSHAPAEATVDQIVEAARALGYRAEPEPDRNYPRGSLEMPGRVKVTKRAGVSKGALLRALAQEIRRRSGGASGAG